MCRSWFAGNLDKGHGGEEIFLRSGAKDVGTVGNVW